MACEQNLTRTILTFRKRRCNLTSRETFTWGCLRVEELSGKIVRLNKRRHGLKQASRQWHAVLANMCLLVQRVWHRKADACVFRLIYDGSVMITIIGEKARCDHFDGHFNEMAPLKTPFELRCYYECFYEGVLKKGVLTISQQAFAEQFADEYRLKYDKDFPLPVGKRLEFEEDEAPATSHSESWSVVCCICQPTPGQISRKQ